MSNNNFLLANYLDAMADNNLVLEYNIVAMANIILRLVDYI